MRLLLQRRAARSQMAGPPVVAPSVVTSVASTLLLAVAMVLVACSQSGAEQIPPTLTAQEVQGQSLFKSVCAACHSTIPDSIIVGPSLAGIAARAGQRVPGLDARAYIEQSIRDPRAFIVEGYPSNQMPEGLGERYSQEEIEAVIAFLFTLQ